MHLINKKWKMIISCLTLSILLSSCRTKIPSNTEKNDSEIEWQQINNGLTNLYVQCIAADTQNPNILYAGTHGGIFKTTNEGDDWFLCNQGMISNDIKCIVKASNNSDLVFAGTWGDGVSFTNNWGESWNSIPLNGMDSRVQSLFVGGGQNYFLLAGTSKGAFILKEKSEEWKTVCEEARYDEISSVSGTTNADVMIIATKYNGVYHSTDNGNSWKKSTSINDQLGHEPGIGYLTKCLGKEIYFLTSACLKTDYLFSWVQHIVVRDRNYPIYG